MSGNREYCGCCGEEMIGIYYGDGLFCCRCIPHIKPYDGKTPIEERIYLAIHSIECPYQIQ